MNNAAVVDTQRITNLKTAMGDKFDEIIQTYIDNSMKNMALINANAKNGDNTVLHRAAHSLKGSSATMGATELAKHSEALELAVHDNTGDIATLVDRVIKTHAETVLQFKQLINSPS